MSFKHKLILSFCFLITGYCYTARCEFIPIPNVSLPSEKDVKIVMPEAPNYIAPDVDVKLPGLSRELATLCVLIVLIAVSGGILRRIHRPTSYSCLALGLCLSGLAIFYFHTRQEVRTKLAIYRLPG